MYDSIQNTVFVRINIIKSTHLSSLNNLFPIIKGHLWLRPNKHDTERYVLLATERKLISNILIKEKGSKSFTTSVVDHVQLRYGTTSELYIDWNANS